MLFKKSIISPIYFSSSVFVRFENSKARFDKKTILKYQKIKKSNREQGVKIEQGNKNGKMQIADIGCG